MRYRFCLLIIILVLFSNSVLAAVFQYRIPIETTKGQKHAFLWLPPNADYIRGIVIGGMTLAERELAKDQHIRKACINQKLAIVFLKCGLSQIDLQKVLDDFTKVSGYTELSAAPIFFVGHSAGGLQAKACAIKMSSRCFGLVQYRGGTPTGDNSVPPNLPVLMMIGQFDEFGRTMRTGTGRETWEGGRDALTDFRAQNKLNLGSIVVEPGAGHFAWSDRNARYLSTFITKAAQTLIPTRRPIDLTKPVKLKTIDYRKGWLTDLSIESKNISESAPWERYTGNKSKAAWHFDREMAQATIDYHKDIFGKMDQFIKWNDPYWVDAGTRFFFTKVQWTGDGQTFRVHPIYADKYPSQYNGRGPRWLQAGKSAGHSDSPIHIKHVSGPVVTTGPDTFRMQYDELAPATESSRVTFMAYSAGDIRHRYTEHVGMMPRGFSGFKKGTTQTVEFPSPTNLKLGDPPLQLTATASSGLPVEYHVAYGPAKIVDNNLEITELPVRAVFPITVKVVAYQFGRGIEPLIKTAVPVEQTVLITEQIKLPLSKQAGRIDQFVYNRTE